MAENTNTLGKGGKFGDLKRRLWFLVGALIVYRIGAHIPVPGIDAGCLDGARACVPESFAAAVDNGVATYLIVGVVIGLVAVAQGKGNGFSFTAFFNGDTFTWPLVLGQPFTD